MLSWCLLSWCFVCSFFHDILPVGNVPCNTLATIFLPSTHADVPPMSMISVSNSHFISTSSVPLTLHIAAMYPAASPANCRNVHHLSASDGAQHALLCCVSCSM